MVKYHFRRGYIEICDMNCEDNLSTLKSNVDLMCEEDFSCKNSIVSKYEKEISSHGEMTHHYRESRQLRVKELELLLGKGNRIQAFLVNKGNGDLQIHELLDNGLLNIYSYHNHRKITLFAPKPERIINLYNSIGELAPESIIKTSEQNVKKGYHLIYFE